MRFLVLGGTNFVGRELVLQLLAAPGGPHDVRVADTAALDAMLPRIAQRHAAALSACTYVQCNLSQPGAHEHDVFGRQDSAPWDAVFNVHAAVWRTGLAPEAHHRFVHDASVACAEAALRAGCHVFVHVSTAKVYKDAGTHASLVAATEDALLEPSIAWAKAHVETEHALRAKTQLPLVILRPAIIYGPGDELLVTQLLVCARVYKELDEVMREVHRGERRMDLVHVRDVARACVHVARWHAEQRAAGTPVPPGRVFNLCDANHTTVYKLNVIVAGMFNIVIKHHWWVVSKNFKLPQKLMIAALEEANEKHMGPWARITAAGGVHSTPLTPYLDLEHFTAYEVAVDGTRIMHDTGFEYTVPCVTAEALHEIIRDFQALGLWPRDDPSTHGAQASPDGDAASSANPTAKGAVFVSA